MRKALPAAESSSVRTLTRGLDVLGLFDAEHPDLAQTEIAQALTLPLPTVHRLCGTLVQLGFLVKDPGQRRLRLGPEILRLAGPMLAGLGATDQARTGLLAPRASIGLRVPAHCTALGKCLLAQLDPEQARAQVGPEPYPARTATTLTSWAVLGPALAAIRETGVSVSREEYERGLVAVAVQAPAGSAQPMAIDLCVPAVRGTEEVLAAAAKRLLDVAAELSAGVGFG